MRRSLILAALVVTSINLHGQTKKFEHIDVSFTAGSTGIGVDVATPICNWLDVRAGFSFVPKMIVSKSMTMTDSTLIDGKMLSKFDKLSSTFEQLTGYKLSDNVEMVSHTNFYHGSLMFDFRPFQNKHWHLTTGLFIGPSEIVSSKNSPECMSTLLSIGTYNSYYNKLYDPQVASGEVPFFSFKGLSIYTYGDEVYIEYGDMGAFKESDLINNLKKYGDLGATLGEKGDGELYRMVPNSQGVITSTVKVNAVKPYLGFGYEGPLSKKTDKYLLGFDCGIMLWGGVPHFYMHDGTDLTYEVSNYKAAVAGYCNLLKRLPVYPVANIRFVRRIEL